MSLDRRRQGWVAWGAGALLALALIVAGCGGDSGSSGGSTASTGANGTGGATGVAKAEEFGSEAKGPEAKGPEAALQGYFDARANGEWSKACSYLSKGLRQAYDRLSKEGCVAFVEKTAERLPAGEQAALAEIEVESVRLEGDSGYVIYTNAEGSQQAKPVEREGGEWKVSSLLVQLFEQANKQSQK